MCAILGLVMHHATPLRTQLANAHLRVMVDRSFERGRDGRGYAAISDLGPHGQWQADRSNSWDHQRAFIELDMGHHTLVSNFRAEPTTEYVETKKLSDQQPYRAGPWTIVHNGTIANDKELRTGELETTIDSAAIVELLNSFPTEGMPLSALGDHFATCIDKLKGSYAILAMHAKHPGTIFAACNYRPIWTLHDQPSQTRYFASSREYFQEGIGTPYMLPPYSAWAFTPKGAVQLRAQPEFAVRPGKRKPHALVVCSGGMDSVVAATMMVKEGYRVTLVHFRYGSRAEGPEVKAVQDVAAHLGVGYWMPSMDIYQPTDSPLLQADSEIAGGEEGAEFAHEWVPARNLVMLSIATAMAEAKGIDFIVLGNNLEEAGAYPDNEPEFIHRFNDLLPFAVGDGKRVRVLMPVGNLMKHEIVAKGLEIGAPLHLTWSCYRAGEKHCGTCGPCHMRKTAFRINRQPEVIQYERD
jgi:7-cyano-7-deazaguanine synthase